jgi:biopolymer transport protein ExbD
VRRKLEPASESVPNLAPMVDVIMVLLIFFLLGASLQIIEEGVLSTELDPRSGPGEGVAVEVIPRIQIALEDVDDGAGVNIYIMGELLGGGFDALHDMLRERRPLMPDPDNPVVVGAGTTVRWKYVIQAMDAAVLAGFKNVQFAVSFEQSS